MRPHSPVDPLQEARCICFAPVEYPTSRRHRPRGLAVLQVMPRPAEAIASGQQGTVHRRRGDPHPVVVSQEGGEVVDAPDRAQKPIVLRGPDEGLLQERQGGLPQLRGTPSAGGVAQPYPPPRQGLRPPRPNAVRSGLAEVRDAGERLPCSGQK